MAGPSIALAKGLEIKKKEMEEARRAEHGWKEDGWSVGVRRACFDTYRIGRGRLFFLILFVHLLLNIRWGG
jgi:hypothetical protein